MRSRPAIGLLMLAALGCQPPAKATLVESGPLRLAVLEAEYGGHPDHASAIAVGERLADLSLALADGGRFELAQVRSAGPVVLVWIGGAEHEGLMVWVRGLDQALSAFEQRSATLVFVRPLAVAPSLRWATDLHLQSVVVADDELSFAGVLDLVGEDRPPPTIDFAVLIVGRDGAVAYRKLGARRPELDELLAILDGRAAELRCCPGACVGSPCAG